MIQTKHVNIQKYNQLSNNNYLAVLQVDLEENKVSNSYFKINGTNKEVIVPSKLVNESNNYSIDAIPVPWIINEKLFIFWRQTVNKYNILGAQFSSTGEKILIDFSIIDTPNLEKIGQFYILS